LAQTLKPAITDMFQCVHAYVHELRVHDQLVLIWVVMR